MRSGLAQARHHTYTHPARVSEMQPLMTMTKEPSLPASPLTLHQLLPPLLSPSPPAISLSLSNSHCSSATAAATNSGERASTPV